jgi:glycosyltransferase involved in cell wall biosynthesis
MKKLLILAYDFPPYVSVGGLRPYSWYKYMHEFGIFPVVVTRQWSNKYGNHLDYIAPGESNDVIIEESEKGIIIRAPYKPTLANRLMLRYGENRFKFLRKIITGWYEFVQWFLPVGTKYSIYKAAKEFLKTNKVDCIIATGEPFILFKYALKLGKKTKIPIIIDYRDLWSYSLSRNKNIFFKNLNIRFELRILKSCLLVSAVSEFLLEKIKDVYKINNSIVITNGYDEELLTDHKNIVITDPSKLILTFVGSIYAWHPLRSVLSVLKEFKVFCESLDIKFELHFYGTNKNKEIVEYCSDNILVLNENIYLHSKLKNDILFKEMLKTDLLLLFNDFLISGTKIYDYLATKKKIILCYDSDRFGDIMSGPYGNKVGIEEYANLQKNIILETTSGIIVTDPEDLFKNLKALLKEKIENGVIKSETTNIEKYSRRYQTSLLAKKILGLIQ